MPKHICSLKIVSDKIDKKWSYDEETKRFSHPTYEGKLFTAICDNSMVENVYEIATYAGKRITKKKEMVSKLYPYINAEDDPENIGYNFCKNNSTFKITSNKMESFWETYRGKRYLKYIDYRKLRGDNKRAWLELNPKNAKPLKIFNRNNTSS
jgi:hypothetical protein